MSSPVSVSVDIVDLDIFASAAKAEGYEMKEIIKNGIIVGLDWGSGYQKTQVLYDEKKNGFILNADSHHVEDFQNKVIPHYNALQLRANLEATNRFTFPENWMTRTSNSEVEVNAFYR